MKIVLDFINQLSLNNNKEWFDKNKSFISLQIISLILMGRLGLVRYSIYSDIVIFFISSIKKLLNFRIIFSFFSF